MPTKPLDRLMFAQGDLRFFCARLLPKSEASVEHLVAIARGGSNSDDNCAACCKSINALMGSMSLKEKIKVVLNQQGRFKCPNGGASLKPTSAAVQPKAKSPGSSDAYQSILATLRKQGKARPRTQKTLLSALNSLQQLALDDAAAIAIVARLRSDKKITIDGNKIAYTL